MIHFGHDMHVPGREAFGGDGEGRYYHLSSHYFTRRMETENFTIVYVKNSLKIQHADLNSIKVLKRFGSSLATYSLRLDHVS